jgi:hypothetical protein
MMRLEKTMQCIWATTTSTVGPAVVTLSPCWVPLRHRKHDATKSFLDVILATDLLTPTRESMPATTDQCILAVGM